MNDKIKLPGKYVDLKVEELIKVREDKLKTLHYLEDDQTNLKSQTNLEDHLLKREEDSQGLSTNPRENETPLSLYSEDRLP